MLAGQEAVTEVSLWALWRNHADSSARERLLALHMPYARVVAASYYAKRFHDEIEFSDYLQLASLGLIEAFDRFDPAVGVQFRTFAARRMHGALLDGVERFTEKQQQIAARQRLEKQRLAAIKEAAMGDSAAAGNVPQVLQYVAEAGLAFALAWILDGTGMLQDGEKTEIAPFYGGTELRQLRQRIADLVNALPAQERCVMQRHYFQQMTFQDVADMLGLSRGRVSQIHRKALERLKEQITTSRGPGRFPSGPGRGGPWSRKQGPPAVPGRVRMSAAS
jgi:RNA polymerase sigma factor for flagellar operon FliA